MALVRGPRIVRNGLVLHLDAAQKTSYSGLANPWKDLSGNRKNGTFTNGPSYNSNNGGSIVFDGSNDYVLITDNTGLQFTNSQAYTISSWVYWTESNFGQLGTIFCFGTSSPPYTGYYFVLDYGAARTESFFFDYFDGVNFKSLQGTANSIPRNRWIHLCGTVSDNVGANMRVYLNGSLASYTDRSSVTPPSNINYSGLTAAVGNRGSSAFQPFEGRIANISIYNKALSASEVLQNYNTTKGRFGL